MNVEELREYCLSKPATEESFPFDEDTLVFKVMGKIFAIIGLNHVPHRINLKCDPEYAIELRERHTQILPGYHMNKMHWNTVLIDEGLPNNLILELIDHSYQLIVNRLPKKYQLKLSDEF